MALLKRDVLLIGLALVFGACNGPQPKHRDAGSTDTPTTTDGPGIDAPADLPASNDADAGAGADKPMVVVAPPGSVANGKPCSKNDDCQSTFCRDDVCCNDSCEGTCYACSSTYTNQDNGTCAFVLAGADPRGVCTDESATKACGQDGTCDGKGACRKQGPDHVCSQASCSADNKFTPQGTCDGNGTCAAGMVMDCAGNPCALTGCAKPCTGDGDCPAGNFCSNGTCKVKKIAGDACDSPGQCASGSCSPDKVCCDSACTDTCKACTEALTGQKNGTCAFVQSGKDPKDDCAADMPSSCGHDGTCDGKGGCGFYGNSQVCSAPSCNGAQFSREGTCDGKGACGAVKPVDCGANSCTLNGCKMSCTSPADCTTGFYCSSPGAMGACLPKKSDGAPCAGSGECADGACVDNVCCESACTETCYACSSALTGQADGKCKPILPAKTPAAECPNTDPSTCGFDGSCDGNGQCRKRPAGSSCGAPACTADNQYLAGKICDGNGTCVIPAGISCGNNKCDVTSACGGSCQDNSKCVGNSYCDVGAMKCLPQKTQGAACTQDFECSSQHCVDNVCCATVCKDVCYACSASRTNQPDGLCQPAISSLDPHHDCGNADTVGCGATGLCDGSGHCAKQQKRKSCGNATCSGSTYTPAPTCDGMGSCVTPASQSCGNAACSGDACATTCASEQDCQLGAYCDGGTHKCAAKKTQSTACGIDGECASGVCAGKVCCNVQCPGPCATCATGTCMALAEGATDSLCTPTSMNTCGLDGTCDRFGHCRKWQGTQCANASCTNNVFTGAGACDGTGTCARPAAQECTPNVCSANGCPTTCATTADCTSGYYCNGMHICSQLKMLGTPCATGAECLMGICADGVCCNSSCDQVCQACNQTNSNGTCTPVSGSSPPGHPSCNTMCMAGTCQSQAMLSGSSQQDYGDLEIGTTSSPRTWTISNNGGIPTGTLSVTNTNSSTFLVTNSCGTTISANGSCSLSVAVKAYAGPITGTITVSASPGGSVAYTVTANGKYRLTVTLAGSGVGRVVSSNPGGIDCGAQCSLLVDPSPNLNLAATVQNGSDSVFVGWSGSGSGCDGSRSHNCNGLPIGSSGTKITATFVKVVANLIFATSGTYRADQGGASSYDKNCNDAATAAGINNVANNGYVAVMSDFHSNVKDRLGNARGWVSMTNIPFADTVSGLFSSNQVFNPVCCGTENAEPTSTSNIFTGTNADGTAATMVLSGGVPTDYTCNGWSTVNANSLGAITFGDGGPKGWAFEFGQTCAAAIRLICMGKTKSVAVAPVAVSGRKIWITKVPFTPGNAETPDARCQSDKPSDVSLALALIPTTTRTAGSILDPQKTYIRPDGTLVGTGAQLMARNPVSGIWQSTDLNYKAVQVWTGGDGSLSTLGTAANTCNNWTQPSGIAKFGTAYEMLDWWTDLQDSCSSGNYYLYCVQTNP